MYGGGDLKHINKSKPPKGLVLVRVQRVTSFSKGPRTLYYRIMEWNSRHETRDTRHEIGQRDRPKRIDLDFLPPLEAAAQKPGGYGKLSRSINSLVDWARFMAIFASADDVTRTRLLTHSGHGGVTSLTSDISCVHTASAETVRVTLRRISGSKALGAFALTVEEVCPGCGLHSDHVEALERHITRCPLGAVKYFMHRGLAYLVARLLRQAGAAKTDIVFEVSNLRQVRRQDKARRCGLAELPGTWTAPFDD